MRPHDNVFNHHSSDTENNTSTHTRSRKNLYAGGQEGGDYRLVGHRARTHVKWLSDEAVCVCVCEFMRHTFRRPSQMGLVSPDESKRFASRTEIDFSRMGYSEENTTRSSLTANKRASITAYHDRHFGKQRKTVHSFSDVRPKISYPLCGHRRVGRRPWHLQKLRENCSKYEIRELHHRLASPTIRKHFCTSTRDVTRMFRTITRENALPKTSTERFSSDMAQTLVKSASAPLWRKLSWSFLFNNVTTEYVKKHQIRHRTDWDLR